MSWLTRWMFAPAPRLPQSAGQAKARLAHLLDMALPCSSPEQLFSALQKELMQVVRRHTAREQLVAKVAFEEVLGEATLRIKVTLAGAPAPRQPVPRQPRRKRASRKRRRRR